MARSRGDVVEDEEKEQDDDDDGVFAFLSPRSLPFSVPLEPYTASAADAANSNTPLQRFKIL